jgi:hypothetical protein
MKRLFKIKHLFYLAIVFLGGMLMQSCAVNNEYVQSSVPVSDIVQMSKNGVSSKDIIKDLKRSHSVYFLQADQLAKLRNEGVQDSVLNYMEKTHIQAVRRNQQAEDYYYGGPGFGYSWYGPGWGWGWGWPYGYGGWAYGPNIIIRGGEGHGDFHGGEEHGEFHGGGRR